MQKVLWPLVVVALMVEGHRFVNPPVAKCEFKADYQTKIYSQIKRERNGRLHGVTKVFFSEKDKANMLVESP